MQYYHFPDGTVVSEKKSHTINGQKWGSGDFTDRWPELQALGVKPYREEAAPTGYQATGWETVEIDGEMVKRPTGTEPKQTVAELKTRLISQIKATAKGKLSATDWYVVRNAETDEAVPQAILDERAGIRTRSDTLEGQVDALDDYDDLLAWTADWEG